MKKLPLIIAGLTALLISSCSNSSSTSGDKFKLTYTTSITEAPIEFTTEFKYNLKDFDKSAEKFNKSIALLSFANCINAAEKSKVNEFYSSIKFENVVCSEDYDKEEDKDSIKHAFAHYDAGSYHLIAVTTNGLGYKLPWENNFVLGAEGDAKGFVIGAEKVMSGLSNYLSAYQDKKIKLWITGYSRSAAISNIVACRLIDENVIASSNMFAYTFEAPQAIDASNEKQYKSIFNVINSGDVVPHLAPSQYGLKRSGNDVDIYSRNIDKWLKKIDNRFRINPYYESEDYANEAELNEKLMELMTATITASGFHDMSTRENYYTYYQDNISYLIGYFMSLKSETITDITNTISSMSMLELAVLLADDGVYKFLTPILDRHGEIYDATKLRESTNLLIKYATNNYNLLAFLISGNNKDNLMRNVQFHYPEIIIVSLNNY